MKHSNKSKNSREHGKKRSNRRSARKSRNALLTAACFSIEPLERRTLLSASPAAASAANASAATGALGLNLSDTSFFSTDAIWYDAAKGFGPWIGAASQANVPSTSLTTLNYPLVNASSENFLTGYPDGIYTLQYQGGGTVTASGKGYIIGTPTTVNGITTAQVVVEANAGTALYLNATVDANNPLHDLHLYEPGYTAGQTPPVFTPGALERLGSFSDLRLMDAFNTNGSVVANWTGSTFSSSNRSLPTQFASGWTYEDAVVLANTLGHSLWLNIPVNATDSFITSLANFLQFGSDASGNAYASAQTNPVHPGLKTGTQVYIEYANELWHTSFYAGNQNQTNATANPALTATKNTPDRDGQQAAFMLHHFYTLFTAAYGSAANLTAANVGFVFGGVQSTYSFDTAAFAYMQANWGSPSAWLTAYAVPDYISLTSTQDTPTLAIGDLFTDLTNNIQTQAAQNSADASYASSFGLQLFAYEGGQDLNLGTGNAATKLQAETDPRMATIYQELLSSWYQSGGSLFNLFVYATSNNSTGAYGLLQQANLDGSPKWDASIEELVASGDLNLDGQVNFADFLLLKQHYGMSGASYQDGDLNGDGVVDSKDLALLQSDISPASLTTAQLTEINSFQASLGTGLQAIYYNDTTFTNPVLSRIDSTVNFNWSSAPPAAPIPSNNFSVEWTGYVEAPSTGTWTIASVAADPINVTVNGQSLIADANSGSLVEDVGNINFVAGQKYLITVKYATSSSNPQIDLLWQTDGTPLTTIPSSMLYPAQQTGTPEVGVVAAATLLSSPNSDTITFTRTNTSGALTVNYTVTGTAVPGTDYQSFTGSTTSGGVTTGTVTFSDGSASTTLTLAPLATSTAIDPVKFSITVDSGTGYTQGSSANVTIYPPGNVFNGPLADTDIGTPTQAGSAGWNPTTGVETVLGSGNDIYGGYDQFNYASISEASDATLITRVTSLTNTSAYAKAGLMFRDGTGPSAYYVTLLITESNGLSYQWRNSAGNATTVVSVAGVPTPTPSAPVWLELVRSGDSYTAFYGTDGVHWTAVGSAESFTPSAGSGTTVLAGLAVTSHDNTQLAAATFDNITIPGASTLTIPAIPSVTATAAPGAVKLAWTAVSGAATYNLYRSTIAGREGTTPYKTGLTGTSYSDTAVTANTPYFYTLTTVNTSGESAQSVETSATPKIPIAAVPTVTATAAPGAVNLTWAAVTGAATYNLYRSTTTGKEGMTPYKTGLTGTSYSDTAVTANTPYFYTLTTVNTSGESAQSVETSATPKISIPAVPTVTATAAPGAVNLTWAAVTGAATYNLYRSTTTGKEGMTPYKTGLTGTSYSDTAVTANTPYFYTLTTVNTSGESAQSVETSATPKISIAAVPTVTATAAAGAVNLSWAAVSGATTYNLYRSTSTGKEGTTPYLTGLTGTSYSDTAVTAKTPYYYTLTAVNTAGESKQSSETSATPTAAATSPLSDADIGSPTTTGSASFVGSSGVFTVAGSGYDIWQNYDQFNFDSAAVSGNATLIARVTSITNTDPWAKAGLMLRDTSDPAAANVGLFATESNGVSFQWRTAQGGFSSSTAIAGVGAPTATAPVWLELVRSGTASAPSFTAFYGSDGVHWTQVGTAVSFTPSGSSLLGGLAVTAHNTSVLNTATFDNVTIPGSATVTVPATPTLAATAAVGAVNLSWAAVSGATTYNLYRSTSTGKEGTTPYLTGLTGTSYSDTAVTTSPATTYYYTLAAVNSAGPGMQSTETSATPTPLAIPAVPTVTATAAAGAVNLSWAAVSGATTYNLYRSTSTGKEGTTPYLTGLTGTSYSDTAVTAKTPYYYTLTAVNTAGESKQSSETSATPTAAATSPLSDADIGSPTTTGSASFVGSSGVFTVAGSGYDIWQNYDQFNFDSAAVSGNATLIARVTSITNTDPWAKAGLMLRDTSDPAAANVGLFATESNGVSFQWRTAQGGFSSSTAIAGVGAPTATAPVWLELVRSGTASAPSFTAFYGSDGVHWTQVGTAVSFTPSGSSLLGGLAVTAHNTSVLNTATFDNVTIPGSATVTVPATPTLAATAAVGAVNLSWAAVSGATTYNLYRSTSTGKEGTTPYLTGLTGTSYSDTAVTTSPATTYYYTLAAVNSAGPGMQSTETSATPTPLAIPAVPTVTATAAAGAVNLSWAAVSGATTYNLYRSTSTGKEGTTPYLTGLTGTSYSDTAVTAKTPYYYTLTAVNTAGESKQSSETSATPTAAATSPLSDADIGSPGVAGSASFNGATSAYTVTGGGTDIYQNYDQFNFDSASITGNTTLIARVTSLTNTDPYAKAGIMLRDGSAPAAANVAIVATASNGVSFQYRTAAGGFTTTVNATTVPTPTATAPVWLKLVRTGNSFTSFYSTDGVHYTQLGTAVSFTPTGASLLGGLAVTSHNNSLLNTATFDNLTL